MSEILVAALLTIPIITATTYLLRCYPRQTIIMVSEGLLYGVPVFAYLALMLVLAPIGSPIGLQVLSMVSFIAVALAPVPVIARRIARRLQAAERRRTAGEIMSSRERQAVEDLQAEIDCERARAECPCVRALLMILSNGLSNIARADQ